MIEEVFEGQTLSIVVERTVASSFSTGESGEIFYTKISNLSGKRLSIEVDGVFLIDGGGTQHSMDSYFKGYFGEDEKCIQKNSSVICAPIFYKDKAGAPQFGYKYGLSVKDNTNGVAYDALFERDNAGLWKLLSCDTEEIVVKRTASQLEKILKRNIERFELLEERKGIKIDGLNIQVASTLSNLALLGEVTAVSQDLKVGHVQIVANFYSESGELVETAGATIGGDEFVGYDTFKITVYDSDKINKMSRVRVFVK